MTTAGSLRPQEFGRGWERGYGHGGANGRVLQVHRSAASTLVMLGRAAELTSAELVDHGGGEPRRRWGSWLGEGNDGDSRGKMESGSRRD